MTSEFPDSYNDSTGLSTTGRAKLVDTMFDHWQDLAEAMRIPWMGDQLLAIASITTECLQRVDSTECAMPDITGEESAGTDDVAAEVQHDDSDVRAAPADVSMGSQDPQQLQRIKVLMCVCSAQSAQQGSLATNPR
jgi:hypothetical protein